MKATFFALALLAFTTTSFAGEPTGSMDRPLKIEIKAVGGKRENISTPGDYAAFRCYSANEICFWKIITNTNGSTDNEPIGCRSQDVNPESFPAILEPDKTYLGINDRNGRLRLIEVNRIVVSECSEGSSTVTVYPYVELDL